MNQRLEVTTYQIQSNKIPTKFCGCKIALLTDLHSNTYGKDNIELIETIELQKPDYIMITGDMIVGNRKFNHDIALDFIGKLSTKYPIYYSLGNHEQKLATYEETRNSTFVEYKDKLIQLGVCFLDNQQVILNRQNQSICVTGLTIGISFFEKVWKNTYMEDDYIEQLIGKASDNFYHILLAHNPLYFKQYAAWGADLVMSGHVHGGIVILPKLGGVIAPNYQLFPKYDCGRFTIGKSSMILSRGLGTHTIKIRIGNPPELVVIELNR